MLTIVVNLSAVAKTLAVECSGRIPDVSAVIIRSNSTNAGASIGPRTPLERMILLSALHTTSGVIVGSTTMHVAITAETQPPRTAIAIPIKEGALETTAIRVGRQQVVSSRNSSLTVAVVRCRRHVSTLAIIVWEMFLGFAGSGWTASGAAVLQHLLGRVLSIWVQLKWSSVETAGALLLKLLLLAPRIAATM